MFGKWVLGQLQLAIYVHLTVHPIDSLHSFASGSWVS